MWFGAEPNSGGIGTACVGGEAVSDVWDRLDLATGRTGAADRSDEEDMDRRLNPSLDLPGLEGDRARYNSASVVVLCQRDERLSVLRSPTPLCPFPRCDGGRAREPGRMIGCIELLRCR